LFFGGLWGFWGVFFAIPLATLVKAVMDAWPREAKSLQLEQGEGYGE
jgi:putative permease